MQSVLMNKNNYTCKGQWLDKIYRLEFVYATKEFLQCRFKWLGPVGQCFGLQEAIEKHRDDTLPRYPSTQTSNKKEGQHAVG